MSKDDFIKMLETRRSTCCDAPIREDFVIDEGENAGHGPRFCSECGKLLYMV